MLIVFAELKSVLWSHSLVNCVWNMSCVASCPAQGVRRQPMLLYICIYIISMYIYNLYIISIIIFFLNSICELGGFGSTLKTSAEARVDKAARSGIGDAMFSHGVAS